MENHCVFSLLALIYFIIVLIFSALENKLFTKICDNVSEVYTRKDVLSPSPSPESEIPTEVSQLPRMTTSETYMPPTEGTGYPVSYQIFI